MNKQQAEKQFKDFILPEIKKQYEQDGVRDLPARQQAWNNFTDSLCKSGEITFIQYESWIHPKVCQ
jgi:hypothetical protein